MKPSDINKTVRNEINDLVAHVKRELRKLL